MPPAQTPRRALGAHVPRKTKKATLASWGEFPREKRLTNVRILQRPIMTTARIVGKSPYDHRIPMDPHALMK
jgi:hypothetical protein